MPCTSSDYFLQKSLKVSFQSVLIFLRNSIAIGYIPPFYLGGGFILSNLDLVMLIILILNAASYYNWV